MCLGVLLSTIPLNVGNFWLESVQVLCVLPQSLKFLCVSALACLEITAWFRPPFFALPLFLLLFCIVSRNLGTEVLKKIIEIEILARATRQSKEIKDVTIRKRRSQYIFICDDKILYITDPKNSTKKQLINTFSKVSEYKINTKFNNLHLWEMTD